jgi:DNA-directed RNA polymerase specialized sigma24 family protein
MADAVGKIVDMEAEIDSLVDRLIDAKREVIHTIEQLKSPLQYDVLHMHYIQFLSFQEIADKYACSYDSVKQAHKRAVRNVRLIRDRK